MADRDLARLQRWMQAVITHPEGVAAGVASERARGEIDVAPEDVEEVVMRSRALDSLERLQVYGHAYYLRLLECLRVEFPASVHCLGEKTFDGFAFGYLQSHPSRSYTLANLGAEFPRFLAETRPEREGDETDPDWADFLVDLAELERAYGEVFDGPGVEGERLLRAEDVQAIAPEHWPAMRLVAVPCLRLMSFRFPVHEYASSVRRGDDPSPPAAEPTWLAITRRDYVVRRQPLDRTPFELLRALQLGQPLGAALVAAAEIADAEPERLAADLRTWFRQWTAAGYFQRVETPKEG